MQENNRQVFDVIISGGGMVGASLAHALTGHGLRIAVIEAVQADTEQQPSYDDRAIALSYGSKRILQALGLWPQIQSSAEPIKNIHVSEQGQFGFARLNAEEENVEALGYVVTARDLGQVFLKRLPQLDDVELFCPAKLEAFNVNENQVDVDLTLDNDEQQLLSAALLIAADGGRSTVRTSLDIKVKQVDYQQSAIVSNLTPQKAHNNVAFERFTESGPVALLPMTQQRCALVYTVDTEDLESVMALSDQAFLEQLQYRFGYRLGKLGRLGQRQSYPLVLKQVEEHVRPRIALIGNAAHAVHPIAGQGFNLGLRDVAVLAEVIIEARRHHNDIGALDALNQYADWRKKDHRNVMTATDSMVKLFSNPLGIVRKARNVGILASDMLPGLRHLISRQAMGLTGKQPKLSRGLTLD
ncbi:MAG: 2-octaprenyl-6-methoxyphenyl hydroxylase [Gammaproteobacteria bacterium]